MFVVDSPGFKSVLRRLCWWRGAAAPCSGKKLLIEQVLDDVSWPPIGQTQTTTTATTTTTTITASNDIVQHNVDTNMTQTQCY